MSNPFPPSISNDRYDEGGGRGGRGGLLSSSASSSSSSSSSSSTAQKIQTTIQYACAAFGMLVLCCWWTLLMLWFNPPPPPPPPPSYTPERDAALFLACERENWSGLDVFLTLASLGVVRVLQAPFKPRGYYVWGVWLLLFSPVGVGGEMVWMWGCGIWVLVTRRRGRDFSAACAAVRMFRLRGIRSDGGFRLHGEAGKGGEGEEESRQFASWNYGDALDIDDVGKTTLSVSAKTHEGHTDDPITADLIAVSQRRHPLLISVIYVLMVLQHYKVHAVTGAGFIKFIVFVYELAFVTTEIIYLMPNPGASIADAVNAMKAFFKDVSHSETETPFSDSVVALSFIGAAGGSYIFAVMAYGISQLFSAFALLFPEDVTGSLALTTAIGLACKMLIVVPGTFIPLGLAMALPFWVMTVRRAWKVSMERSVLDVGPVGSWEWMFAPLHDLQRQHGLRRAMLNYAGVVLWFVLFWDLVRVRDGKLPFVQHPDLAYNCSSTIRDADSLLFLL